MTTLDKIKAELKRRYWKTNQGKPSKRNDYNNAIDDALKIIDKYAEQDKCEHNCEDCEHNDGECCRILFERSFEQEPTDEWQNGYDRALEEAEVFYEKEEPFGPCDLCRFNPPSSADGKPCTMCPAEKGGN